MKARTLLTIVLVGMIVAISTPESAAQNTLNFAVSTPTGIAFDGANLWVASFSNNSVTKLRADDGANLGVFAVGTNPVGVVFDESNIWVANHGTNTVTKLRASDGVNLATITVGTNPLGLAFDGANLWVSNFGSNSVTKLRASDGAILGTFAVAAPYGLAFDGANIWVANSGSVNSTVTKLRASDGANLGTFAAGTSPTYIAFDGANIWVTNHITNRVTKVRTSDGATIGSFAVGASPLGVVFAGASIWVANNESQSVTKLRASDGANLGTFPAGSKPHSLAFDGANVWVTNNASGTVTNVSCGVSVPLTANGTAGTINITMGIGSSQQTTGTWMLGFLIFSNESLFLAPVPLFSGTLPVINPPLTFNFAVDIGTFPAVGVLNAFFNPNMCAHRLVWISTASGNAISPLNLQKAEQLLGRLSLDDFLRGGVLQLD